MSVPLPTFNDSTTAGQLPGAPLAFIVAYDTNGNFQVVVHEDNAEELLDGDPTCEDVVALKSDCFEKHKKCKPKTYKPEATVYQVCYKVPDGLGGVRWVCYPK